MRTSPRPKADVAESMNGDDGGFVIVWMALMLLVLLAFCGFGIDVANWWFVGQKEQRAADAAALAGSVYLPNDFPTGRAQAIFVAAQNGYKNGVNATVTATQEPQPSSLFGLPIGTGPWKSATASREIVSLLYPTSPAKKFVVVDVTVTRMRLGCGSWFATTVAFTPFV